MIGWLLAGAMIGAEAKKNRERRDARAARRAQKRRESPMPNAVWVTYGVVAVMSLTSPPAIPGMLLIGCGIWWYAEKRRREHQAWKAAQDAATVPLRVPSLHTRAAAYDRLGMPRSAQAMRALRDIA